MDEVNKDLDDSMASGSLNDTGTKLKIDSVNAFNDDPIYVQKPPKSKKKKKAKKASRASKRYKEDLEMESMATDDMDPVFNRKPKQKLFVPNKKFAYEEDKENETVNDPYLLNTTK